MPRSRAKPDRLKLIQGTWRKDRSRRRAVPVIPGVPTRPRWLSPAARAIWAEKVATYARRGMSVVGMEATLAVYCTIESELIDRWRRGTEIPVSLLTCYRLYCVEFFDSPASASSTPSPTGGPNAFIRPGRGPVKPA